MGTTSHINPERLKGLRTQRGLSQKELARKIGRDPRTVSRWEQGNIDRVRQDTLGKLCKALDATPHDLCGEGPLPPKPSQSEPPKGQINVTVGSACRNALGLVTLRYGVTRQEIVEAAPLMFFILAEQSLRERRRRLDDFCARANALSDAVIAHLPGWYPTHDDALQAEAESIDARDLFASRVREQVGWSEAPEGMDDLNPFTEFLRNSLKEVSTSAEFRYWVRGLSLSYRICAEEAATIVGGDVDAVSAILSGVAAVHEMAKDVPNGSPTERATWAKAQAEKDRREAEEFAEWLEELPTADKGDAAISGDQTAVAEHKTPAPGSQSGGGSTP